MELLTLLRTIAPEFEELEDTTLQTWLDLTQPLVSKSAFDAAYEQAVAYLAAHRMKMAGLGESGAFGSAIDRAGVTSYTEGSTSVSFGSGASFGGRSGFIAYPNPVWIGVPALAAGNYPDHGEEGEQWLKTIS